MAVAWYARVRGQMMGPLPPQELKALATSGQLAPDSLVRQGTTGPWIKAARVKGLFGSAADVSANDASTSAESSAARGARPLPGEREALSPLEREFESLPSFSGEPAVPKPLSAGQTTSRSSSPDAGDRAETIPFSTTVSERDDPFLRRDPFPPGLRAFSGYRAMAVAVIAVVFGFVGVCAGLLPIIPIVLGVAGAILSLRALGMGARDETLQSGFSLIGGVLSLVACLWGLQTTLSSKDPMAELSRIFGTDRSPSMTDVLQGGPGFAGKWFDASAEQAVVGEVSVQINNVAVVTPGRAPQEVPGNPGVGRLMVSVSIQNDGQRKRDYNRWSDTTDPAGIPKLQDDLGSNYRLVVSSESEAARHSAEALYPGRKVVDTLVFERPVDTYKDLYLTLPVTAFGADTTDPIHFRIPKSQVGTITRPPAQAGAGPLDAPEPRQPKPIAITPKGEEKLTPEEQAIKATLTVTDKSDGAAPKNKSQPTPDAKDPEVKTQQTKPATPAGPTEGKDSPPASGIPKAP